MVQSSVTSAAWYKALTLGERLPIPAAAVTHPNGVRSDSERARQRLDQWRTQTPFATDGYFQQRLAADNLCEDDLLHLLGESTEALRQRLAHPPQWLASLTGAFRPSAPRPVPPSAA